MLSVLPTQSWAPRRQDQQTVPDTSPITCLPAQSTEDEVPWELCTYLCGRLIVSAPALFNIKVLSLGKVSGDTGHVFAAHILTGKKFWSPVHFALCQRYMLEKLRVNLMSINQIMY